MSNNEILHNYCARQYFDKNRLKLLIYFSKRRFFACFCLVLVSLATLCKGLIMIKNGIFYRLGQAHRDK